MARRQNSLGVLLRLTAFRRMWIALSVSSLGDWLGLLATTALAAYLTKNTTNLIQGAAVSGVLLVRLLPDLILGPIAGALVDRFDRRTVAIVGDSVAGLLYLSIAVTGNLTWLLAAQFLVEAVGLFSNPAKQALWVNIVPRERLAVANQLNYVSVYGMVPVAAVVFALLATTAQFFGAPPVPNAGATSALISGTSAVAINIALVLDAASYFLAAGVLFATRRLIPAYLGERPAAKSVFSLIREGVGFVKNSRLMRAIYVGILGAFGAGGLVAGVAQAYVATMGAGNAGYGILFGTVFSGLALGMLIGPKVLPAVPRRIVFTMCIGAAGIALVVMSLLQDFVGAAVTSVVMGLFAGIAWITGFTMIGHEVSDRLRGRVFAFVMSSVRITLLGTIAVGPILANSIGFHPLEVGAFRMVLSGPAIVLAVSGVLTIVVALFAGRQVGGLRGALARRVLRRLVGSRRRDLLDAQEALPGALITVVGADTDATDRYARALAERLDADGWRVRYELAGPAVLPSGAVPSVGVGAHPAGSGHPGSASRGGDGVHRGAPHPTAMPIGDAVAAWTGAAGTEASSALVVEDTPATALRAMADLADLVDGRLRPALEAGEVVVCRDFVDAAVVRFGAQAGLAEERMIRLASWATGGLHPDLILLVDPWGDALFERRAMGDGDDATPDGGASGGASGGAGGDDEAPGAGGEGARSAGGEGAGPAGGEGAGPAGGEGARPAGDEGARPAGGEGADAEDEPVDPRRVYQDLAASAPERYLSVSPLAVGEPVPSEIVERVSSALRQRSPGRRTGAPPVVLLPGPGLPVTAVDAARPGEPVTDGVQSPDPGGDPGPGIGPGVGTDAGPGAGTEAAGNPGAGSGAGDDSGAASGTGQDAADRAPAGADRPR